MNNRPINGLWLIRDISLHLKRLTMLSSLNLASNFLAKEFVQIASALMDLTRLEVLNIAANLIHDHGAMDAVASLGNALLHLRPLKVLNLSENWLDSNQVTALAPKMQFMQELQELDMSRNNMRLPGLSELCRLCLGTLVRLRRLDLSVCALEDNAVRILATTLLPLSSLHMLNLSGNIISNAGVSDVATLTQLTDLHLRQNSFWECKHLTSLRNLTRLDLSTIPLDDDARGDMVAILRNSSQLPSLKFLVAQNNRFSSVNQDAMLAAADSRGIQLNL
jgi:Ran GTPase-activating protein (RanGAP) involved in mRNA processing and transport